MNENEEIRFIGKEDGPELMYTHPATGERDYKGFPIVGEPGPEIYTLPTGASVFPNNYRQQQETLWEIVQEVAERDSTYGGLVDCDGAPTAYYCPFLNCDGELPIVDALQKKPFPHTSECIVTKARALMEWRKAQPKVTIQVKNDFSPAVSPIAEIVCEIAEKFKKKEQ